MISTLDCARACYDIYYHPERFDERYDGDVYAGLIERADYIMVACRGSVTAEDWMHDFELDFERGVSKIASRLLIYKQRKPWVLTGHSLGGAHALLLLQHVGFDIAQIAVTFGAPACLKNDDGLDDCYIEQWRNGHDPVPIIPIPGFYHARDLKTIGPLISPGIRSHEIEGYVASLIDGA